MIDDYDPSTNPFSAAFSAGPYQYGVDYNAGGGHRVALVVVPEPAPGALLIGGFGWLGLRRRRRVKDSWKGQWDAAGA